MQEQALTSEYLAKQLQQSQALFEISQLLAGTIDLPTTLQQIADAATALIKKAERTTLHLLDERDSTLEPVAVAGVGQVDKGRRLNLKPGEGIAGHVLASGQTILVPDVIMDPRYIPIKGERANIRSLLVAPVKTDRKNLGTLSVQCTIPGVFSSDDERLLTILGLQAAVAIEKAQLYADLQASLEHEKAARAQLVQSEKLAALGRIVASVAHELNNPLQAIQNALYLIRMEESLSVQAQEDLRTVLSETERMASLIGRLKEIYRPVTHQDFKPESINQLVTEVKTLLSTHLRHNQIQFEFLADENLPLLPLIRDQILQVILNICLNAVEAMPDGGKLSIQTIYRSEQDAALMIISDTGMSINPKILPYIFDPFVTTKEGGTGLGLAISYDIVQRHNGRIEVDSAHGKGSTFQVWLPANLASGRGEQWLEQDG